MGYPRLMESVWNEILELCEAVDTDAMTADQEKQIMAALRDARRLFPPDPPREMPVARERQPITPDEALRKLRNLLESARDRSG